MSNFIRTALLSSVLLCITLLAGIPASAQISVGIRIGAPPEPRVVAVVPAQPGPEFVWIGGYWYPVEGHYRWHEGYWSRPPYEGARWVGPRHDGERFYNGYWDGDRGRMEHSHKWDHDHERDHGRYKDHDDHDHGHGHDHDEHHDH
jgi:WXXGXW repeat (2 copies)